MLWGPQHAQHTGLGYACYERHALHLSCINMVLQHEGIAHQDWTIRMYMQVQSHGWLHGAMQPPTAVRPMMVVVI